MPFRLEPRGYFKIAYKVHRILEAKNDLWGFMDFFMAFMAFLWSF